MMTKYANMISSLGLWLESLTSRDSLQQMDGWLAFDDILSMQVAAI